MKRSKADFGVGYFIQTRHFFKPSAGMVYTACTQNFLFINWLTTVSSPVLSPPRQLELFSFLFAPSNNNCRLCNSRRVSLTRGYPSNLAVVRKGRWSVFRSFRAHGIPFPVSLSNACHAGYSVWLRFSNVNESFFPPDLSALFLLPILIGNARCTWCTTVPWTACVRERIQGFRLHRGYVSLFWMMLSLRLMLQVKITFRAQLFEGRLALNPGFFFFCSEAFFRIIFLLFLRASNHQLVDKKN